MGITLGAAIRKARAGAAGLGALFLLWTAVWGWVPSDLKAAERKDFSGIDVSRDDSRQVLRRKIPRGETLANILLSYRVPNGAIGEIERASREIFDVRSLRAGNSYFVINELDTADRINYLIYEHSQTAYVVFKLDDPVDVYLYEKPFELKEKSVSGTIASTFYEALVDNPLSYEIVRKTTELFTYQIDFHHLQKGDYFDIIYTEKDIGKESAVFGDILAVYFNHRGRDYFAFYYRQGGAGRYYDQNGHSLEKRFLKAPLTYAIVSSPYQKRRLHPIHNRYIPHLGIDYAAPEGTPIMSVGDGVVTRAEYQREMGYYITVAHNGIYTTQYLHLSRFAGGIRPGARVKRSEVIGFVGSTGTATGPHVEYRLYKNGRPIDPQKEELPSAEPLDPDRLETFQRRIAGLKERLDEMELSTQSKETSIAKR